MSEKVVERALKKHKCSYRVRDYKGTKRFYFICGPFVGRFVIDNVRDMEELSIARPKVEEKITGHMRIPQYMTTITYSVDRLKRLKRLVIRTPKKYGLQDAFPSLLDLSFKIKDFDKGFLELSKAI